MNHSLQTVPLAHLLLGFLPAAGVLLLMQRWRVGARGALYANVRMLVQLLLVGYVLTWVFRTDRSPVVAGVLTTMIAASAWIALRPLRPVDVRHYARVLVAIAAAGLAVLAFVTRIVLDVPRWFEPSVVIPLAGMIFATAMNTVSLAAERFHAERGRGADAVEARAAALQVALIPQINGLLAVGLVSLPGMMTGQILSGIEPLVAVRYQIVVMCMVFGAGGLGASLYLTLAVKEARRLQGAAEGTAAGP